jgi:hypothetical protein
VREVRERERERERERLCVCNLKERVFGREFGIHIVLWALPALPLIFEPFIKPQKRVFCEGPIGRSRGRGKALV